MGIPLFTAKDAMDHLRDTEFGIAQDGQLTVLKGVIRDAYTDLMARYPWRPAIAEYQIALNAYYNTGTIAYDHTGGSSELMVTLTTGTWPTWAANGRLRIGTATYEINQRVSSSVITLDPVMNPGADVSSTSDWMIYQTAYDLPDDFHSLAGFIEDDDYTCGSYIEPNEWLGLDRVTKLSGQPFNWTILPSTEAGSEGKMAVRLSGYPTTAGTLSFFYRQQPLPPKWIGTEPYATVGTISTAGTVTVTGSSTNFVSSMEGAVIRAGDATNAPTGDDGLYPYAEERRIRTVASTTSLTSTVAFSNTSSGLKYVISSIIPLPLVLRTAYKAALEFFMAVRQKDISVQQVKEFNYRRQLELAAAAEVRNTETKVAMRPVPDITPTILPHVISSRSS